MEDRRASSQSMCTLGRDLLLYLVGVSEIYSKHHCYVSLYMNAEITYDIWHAAFSYDVQQVLEK